MRTIRRALMLATALAVAPSPTLSATSPSAAPAQATTQLSPPAPPDPALDAEIPPLRSLTYWLSTAGRPP